MTQAPTLSQPLAGWSGHARGLLGLALPLIGSNIAGFAIHATDVVLMGWYDVTALAGIVLASSFYFILFITGSGFAVAVMPLVATAAQEGDATEVRRVTRMGLWLILGFAALIMPILIFSGPLLASMGQKPEVADYAGRYLHIAGWMIVPALVISLLRSFLSALEHTAVLLWSTIGIAVMNAVLGYAFIFGRWGFPEMGIEGAAWVALTTNSAGALALLGYAVWKLPEYRLLQRLWRPDWAALDRVFRLGWPIGGQLLAEVGLFAGSAMMVGWVGAVPLAAHGVALQLASLTFMLHLGLSQAVTVRTGQALGRGDSEGMRQGALVAILMSAGFALLASAVFLLWPETLLSLFVDPSDPARPQVLEVGVTLLALAAVFQIFDGAQVLAIGLLRGIQDTAIPMVLAALSYWVIGLPAAYAFGFVFGGEEIGVWLGLVISLVCAASLLMARFWRLASRPLTGLHA
ncbi:Multidrug and toxin extrusion (MATE) family efflux pump YdhE/NorM,-like protein [Rubellimicrobium mesophilum DSM 19309]|uniref:Multidrug-efflux transporter n=1 Tax=Rubellimicrobium mesophilum DSM 19309 TaxID=442562 RepID=A0A017HV96_9RHOB|nr:MATE family efflux transporter [Rubellimicrobium mesophilum]EYD78316.1 Multidrug and toxin extrusion (MATE) family efflux pump YdhE/NorM,-like protein [Rubellimicrobium mesophilum DSM 19309]